MRARFDESLAIYRELKDPGRIAMMLRNLGSYALGEGDLEEARKRSAESLALYRELGSPLHIAQTLRGVGKAAA